MPVALPKPFAFLASLGLLSAMALTGCQTTSSMEDAKADNVKNVAGDLVFDEQDLLERGMNTIWRQDLAIESGSRLAHAVVLGDRLVTVEHPTNYISVFDLSSGKHLWSDFVGNDRERAFAPVRHEDTLYVATETHLYKFDANTGHEGNRQALPNAISTNPATNGEVLVFGSATGTIWAQRLDTGGYEWGYQMGGKITGQPVFIDDSLVVSDIQGNIVMLSPQGKRDWGTRAHEAVTTPAVQAGLSVYVAANDQALYGLLLNSGKDLWPAFRSEVALDQTPLADASGVYLPIPGKQLVAINAVDGKARWTIDMPLVPAADDAQHVLAVGPDAMYHINKSSGDIADRVASEALKDLILVEGERLLAVTKNGHLALINLD